MTRRGEPDRQECRAGARGAAAPAALYEAIFDEIDQLALAGARAIEAGDLAKLGELMNINQGLLNALQVSTPELEELIHVARDRRRRSGPSSPAAAAAVR